MLNDDTAPACSSWPRNWPTLARSSKWSISRQLGQQQETLDQAEQKMQEWQDLWDQFRREFHQVHEAAQIENRGIEHIERQVQRTEQQRVRLQQELDGLDTSAAVREINELEGAVEARCRRVRRDHGPGADTR